MAHCNFFFLKNIANHWQIIKKEALNALFGTHIDYEDEVSNLRKEGLWQQLVLFEKGFKDQKGCSLAPQTCSLLEKYMQYSATKCQRGQIKFSVMHSGTHVQPHNGPTNTRLRAHLGLLIPDEGGLVEMRIADKRLKWSDGKIFVIDDRYLSFTCTIHL